MKLLVTGGAGFIGSALIRHLMDNTDFHVVNVDKLTYAGNLMSLEEVALSPRYKFCQIDIQDRSALDGIFRTEKPDAVMHLAAESHVDRSIEGPALFIGTNIVGTYTLLEAARAYWSDLQGEAKAGFRFQHISTDEVYGDLGPTGAFTETSPYQPSSPYSASKASADHLVRAWHRTYGLPVLITNCSNNYGPCQFPEKLIPLMILNALKGDPLTVYGQGLQIRDWLYVDDHVRALLKVLEAGEVGQTYVVGGGAEMSNIDVVRLICARLEERALEKPAGVENYEQLITYVTDRPGHDFRYAIDSTKLKTELGWRPKEDFHSGMKKTIDWYLGNMDWCRAVLDGSYRLEATGELKNPDSEAK